MGQFSKETTVLQVTLWEAANVIRRTRYDAGGLIYCQRQSSGQRFSIETLGFEGLTSRWLRTTPLHGCPTQ
jgi:hypothetical protein